MAYSHTYGVKFAVYDTDNSTYLPVGGITSLTPPSVVAGDPIEVSNHTSPQQFREFVPNPMKGISDMTCEFGTDYADAGQNYIRAHIAEELKFKVELPDLPVVAINAIVVSVVSVDYDLESASRQTVTLKPNGPLTTP